MIRTTPLALLLLAGCPSDQDIKADCETMRIWLDADGDGFGGEELEPACAIGDGQVDRGQDCNDSDDTINPDAEELCDALDNDCDGQIDQGLDGNQLWYADSDDDGFGVQYPAILACTDPGDGWTDNADDCDDTSPSISPNGVEVCNGGIDDNCDGLEDDADPNLDLSSQSTWYVDDDGDGYGTEVGAISSCLGPAGYVDNADDCADDNPNRSPDTVEVCNQRDDDCDELIDDADPDVDPATQTEFFEDNDDDGFGGTNIVLACDIGLGASDNDDDCDDYDPQVTVPTDWYADNDGDGYGRGPSLAFQCFPPVPGYSAPSNDDCRDNDYSINPGVPEDCYDNIDHNCDGRPNCCDDTKEVAVGDTCYYLDGSGGNCDAGYQLAPQSILNAIANDFIGLDYKNQVSTNCCIWHADQAVEMQDWGFNVGCNASGPFTAAPALGGAGCTNALNLNAGQLTLCMSN